MEWWAVAAIAATAMVFVAVLSWRIGRLSERKARRADPGHRTVVFAPSVTITRK